MQDSGFLSNDDLERAFHRQSDIANGLNPLFRELFRENLDRDASVELRVASAVNFSHTAFSNWRDDLVGAEARSGFECHFRRVSVTEIVGVYRT